MKNILLAISICFFVAGVGTYISYRTNVYPEHRNMQKKIWPFYIAIGIIAAVLVAKAG